MSRQIAKRLIDAGMHEQGTFSSPQPPAGFKYLSCGGTRNVFLHEATKQVYKLQAADLGEAILDSYGSDDINRLEWENYLKVKGTRRPAILARASVHIPRFYYYDFGHTSVVQTKYIEGKDHRVRRYQSPWMDFLEKTYRFDDLSVNTLMDTHGRLWIIDLGATKV